ncbi:MAG TPA: hypothetical protein VLF59_00670 [Candidatus Saccharimonadales bacterium]|nr:hypothetical protein [Candidatus Saccharimonadales bacterium]
MDPKTVLYTIPRTGHCKHNDLQTLLEAAHERSAFGFGGSPPLDRLYLSHDDGRGTSWELCYLATTLTQAVALFQCTGTDHDGKPAMFYVGAIKTSSTTDWHLTQRTVIGTPMPECDYEELPLLPQLHNLQWHGQVLDQLAANAISA